MRAAVHADRRGRRRSSSRSTLDRRSSGSGRDAPGGPDLHRRPRRQQRGRRARRSPHRGWPISVVADDSSFPELFELLRAQREQWGVHAHPVAQPARRSSASCAAARCSACSIDWGYRSDGIPVRLFGAWTTLPAGPGDARRQDRRRGSCRSRSGASRDGRLPGRAAPSRSTVPSTDPAELQRATQAIADALADDDRARRPSSGTASSRCGRRPTPRAPTSSVARARCRPGRPDPGPGRGLPPRGRRPATEADAARPRPPSRAAVRRLRGRLLLAASWLACRLPRARSSAFAGAGRRPVVPARARAAPPRRGATSAGSCRALAESGRGSPAVRAPRPTRGPSSASCARPSAMPPATTSRSRAPRRDPRPTSTSASRSRRPSSSPRRSSPGKAVLFVGLHFGSVELAGPVPRVPGRRDGRRRWRRIDDPGCRPSSSAPAAWPAPPGRPARGAPRAPPTALRDGIPVGLVGDRDLTGGGIDDPALRGAGAAADGPGDARGRERRADLRADRPARRPTAGTAAGSSRSTSRPRARAASG